MKECRACKATYDDMFMFCPICAKPLADKATTKRKVSSEQEKTDPKPKSENITGVKRSKKAETLKAASLSLDPDKKKPASKVAPQKEEVKAAPITKPTPDPVVAVVSVPPKCAPAPRIMPTPEPVVAAVPAPPKRAPAPRVMPAAEPVVATVPAPPKRAPLPRTMPAAEPVVATVPAPPKRAPLPRTMPAAEPVVATVPAPPKRAPVPKAMPASMATYVATVNSSPYPLQRKPVASVPARLAGPQPQIPSFAVVADQKISQSDLEADSYYDDVIPEDYGEAAEKKKINKTKMIQAGALIIGLIILIVIVAMNL